MKRHTILVVDDEADVVQSVQDLLRLDYRVLGTTHAAQGMDLMGKEEIHVVMTDQRMPEMSGVEFLHQVRHEHPEAIRLLFTGYADIRAVIDAINQGNVYRYITKPWDPEELQGILREAVERHDLIVQRRQLMDELQQKNQELEHMNQELQQSSALKSAFIQVASHELRTPLAVLLGLSWLAERGAELPEVQDLVRRMTQAGRRLQHLVDQLTTMLWAGRFQWPLERASVDLGDLLREAAEDVRPFIERRRQELAVEAPSDGGAVQLDRARIRDALQHLLLNAIKFTPDGGQITLGARRDEAGAELFVTDTGPGLEPAAQRRVFEPFFTGFDVLHHSSGQFEHNRRGLGLGLSVVKAFAEMHGGQVTVRSEPGQGATFTISLPEQAEARA